MTNRLFSPLHATRADLVDASKAIHDTVKTKVLATLEKRLVQTEGEFRKLLERVKAAEDKALLAGQQAHQAEAKALEAETKLALAEKAKRYEVDSHTASLSAHFTKELDEKVKTLDHTYQTRMKALAESYDKGLAEIKGAMEKRGDVATLVEVMLNKGLERETNSLIREQEGRSKELREFYTKGLEDAKKFFQKDVEGQVGVMEESLHKALLDADERQNKALDSVRGYCDSRMVEIKDYFDKGWAGLSKEYEEKLLQARNGVQEIKGILQSLPVPQVVMPESAIKVYLDQKAAEVVVNVPELNVKNVVPEQPVPVVNVTVPRRKVLKTIDYDDAGRPKHIVEEEVEG